MKKSRLVGKNGICNVYNTNVPKKDRQYLRYVITAHSLLIIDRILKFQGYFYNNDRREMAIHVVYFRTRLRVEVCLSTTGRYFV